MTDGDAPPMPRLGPPWWWGVASAVVFVAGLLQLWMAAYLAGVVDDDLAAGFQRTAIGEVMAVDPPDAGAARRTPLHLWVEVPVDEPFATEAVAFIDQQGVQGAPVAAVSVEAGLDEQGDGRLDAPSLPGYRVDVDGTTVQGIPAGRVSLAGGEYVLSGAAELDGLRFALAEEAMFPGLDDDALPVSFVAGLVITLAGGVLAAYGAWRRRRAHRRLARAIAREQGDAA